MEGITIDMSKYSKVKEMTFYKKLGKGFDRAKALYGVVVVEGFGFKVQYAALLFKHYAMVVARFSQQDAACTGKQRRTEQRDKSNACVVVQHRREG